MSKALRDRRNREDTAVRGLDLLLGAVVYATEYTTGRCDVSVKPAVPGSATVAGRMDSRLIQGEK